MISTSTPDEVAADSVNWPEPNRTVMLAKPDKTGPTVWGKPRYRLNMPREHATPVEQIGSMYEGRMTPTSIESNRRHRASS